MEPSTERPAVTTLPATKDRFGLDDEFIAELQKALSRNYDTCRAQDDFSSAQVWGALTAYIEAGSDQRREVSVAHDMQRGVFKLFFGAQNRGEVVGTLDEAIQSKDRRRLVSAMGQFVAANITDPKQMVDFSEKAMIDVEGLLASQGI